ncbi:MAG TPA: MFS transporter [Thermoleophilaceae bacterium]
MRTPRIARLYAAMVVARMSIGIDGIATVLFLRHEGGSFALAGAAAGALALGAALGAPFAARLIDRLSPRVLIWLALGHAGGLMLFVALAIADAPSALLVVLAFLTGATLPTVSSVLRSAYATLLAEERRLVPSAFALEAVLTEAIFIVGPLATAALTWLISAAAALVLSAGTVIAGTAWFLAELPAELADRRVPEAGERHWAGALRSPGLQTIVISMLPVGFSFGAIEVMLPAFADAEGNRQFAGVLIAIWSIGSALGGILYGARPRLLPLRTMHLCTAAVLPVALAVLVLPSSQAAMAALVVLAGLPIAPLIATRNELAGVVALPGSETEAFTWPLTALVSGVALGAAVAGALADGPGWRAAVLAAVAASALGAVVSVARRGTLGPVGLAEPVLT